MTGTEQHAPLGAAGHGMRLGPGTQAVRGQHRGCSCTSDEVALQAEQKNTGRALAAGLDSAGATCAHLGTACRWTRRGQLAIWEFAPEDILEYVGI